MEFGSRSVETLLREAEAHLTARRYRECHGLCIEAIKRDPVLARPYFLLGILTADHSNFPKAIELFERAAALAPEDAGPRAQHAKCLTAINRHAEASQMADAAARLSPSDALTLDTIGVVLARVGRHGDAVPFFRRAAEKVPGEANYHYNLASSLQFSGQFDEAEMAYRRAIGLAPAFYKVYSSLVSLKSQAGEHDLVPAMEKLFDQCADPDGRLHLGHALAKSYEDKGEYERALSWLTKGKEKKRAALGYEFSSDERLFGAARALPRLTIKEDAGKGGPIFIVGMPRTGTTLVDRILSSHSGVTSMGELTNFGLLLKKAARTTSPFVLDPETLSASVDLDLSAIGRAYLDETTRLRGEAASFIDKMPLNFFYAPLILAAMPSARIICLTRGPMDACLSNYRQLFRTSYSYYNYAYDLGDTALYYAGFRDLIAAWAEQLPPSRFTQVAYEGLVQNQECETRRLIEFCGLDWEEGCLAFHENAAPVATASSVQVRKPLYTSSIGRWRRYGDALKPLENALRAAGIEPV